MRKNNTIKLFAISGAILLSGCTPRGCNSGNGTQGIDCVSLKKNNKIELIYWRLFEDTSIMNEIIDGFEKKYPRIKIKVIKKDYANYYNNLEESFGSVNNRPDIVQIRNDWFVDFQNKLISADPKTWPGETAIAALNYVQKKEICDNPNIEIVPTTELTPIIKPTEIDQNFAPIIMSDTVINDRVYGTSLYIETMGIFYNKDIFRKAIPKIEDAPTTWEEFARVASRLTEDINGNHPGEDGFDYNNIAISGAAFGDSQLGVNRATDILSAMMMQIGVTMSNDKVTQATFDNTTRGRSGSEILDFYTSFTDPTGPNASWNGDFAENVGADEAFRQGKVAMIVNYPHKLRDGASNYWEAVNSRDPITGKNPRFDLGVAELPIFAENRDDLTYGSYFAESVSSIDHPYESWLFLRYLTGLDEEFREDTPVWKYASATNLPASRTGQDFLTNQINFPHIGKADWRDSDTLEPLIKPFVMQVSKAVSWKKRNPKNTENVFSSMIISVQKMKNPNLKSSDSVPAASPEIALSAAAQCITRVYQGSDCSLSDIL